MAKAKTSPFWLTAQVDLTANDTYTQTTIPLGSYIDVASKQAVAIISVDYFAQNTASNSRKLAVDSFVDFQLTDINRNALVVGDDTALISSGALAYDNAPPSFTNSNDLYPDSFGTLSEARMVVNDDIFFGAQSDSAASQNQTAIVRIQAQVVKLTEKDFMALALTSVASA
tara:strand:- start:1105 stop:1617 length:513 start_codon:yes stop_codon:yes gene_type:complete